MPNVLPRKVLRLSAGCEDLENSSCVGPWSPGEGILWPKGLWKGKRASYKISSRLQVCWCLQPRLDNCKRCAKGCDALSVRVCPRSVAEMRCTLSRTQHGREGLAPSPVIRLNLGQDGGGVQANSVGAILMPASKASMLTWWVNSTQTTMQLRDRCSDQLDETSAVQWPCRWRLNACCWPVVTKFEGCWRKQLLRIFLCWASGTAHFSRTTKNTPGFQTLKLH